MATKLQLRRGNTTQNNSFTGAIGELSYDTTLSQVRIHDGSTAGGKILQDTSNLVTGVLASTNTDTQYPSAKCVYDGLALKQAVLVSGTSIKTVNSQSLLGSGDISITATASWGTITGSISDNADLTAALNAKATNADVVHLTSAETLSGDKTFTGSVSLQSTATAVTQSTGDKTTKVATTAFVDNTVITLLANLYPVGSVYIGTQTTCPMATLISGSTWTLVSSGKALWTGDGTNANTTIDAGLPNITGGVGDIPAQTTSVGISYGSGAFSETKTANYFGCNSGGSSQPIVDITFDASNSNSIYGNSTTVQPPAYVVNVWRRES